MPELLTGTVTFLFTDIESSTRLVRSQGDDWPRLLDRHGALLRAAFEAHEGAEVGTEGDSFFVAFPSAPGAVAATVDAQRALAAEPWPAGAEIRVRMGMHTGEATFSAKTYAGLHVHRASRIAGVAHGGQVLISGATRALLGELPDGVELRGLGEHRLKDIEHPERIWQLVIAGLPSDFPAISSLDAVRNNLPTSLTTFLGREREIGEVADLLGDHRLLTLIGPGGTGKTRLSLEVASRSLGRFPDGVYFVELSAITDAALVLPTIAMALSLPDRGGRSPLDRLVDYIGEQHVLLVLDNFEQVIDAAPAVNDLLAACPSLAIIVSSRIVLRVSGEQEYHVPPLGIPDPAHLPPLDQLSQYESVALFIERARAVKASFEVTNDNAPAVAEICVRLDGLPLAIELAAARVRILTPQAMLARLSDRLGLLSGGSRDLPERQQTLRGAIAWSHDLLDEPDRSLFAGMSVFAGGASLEAIERVCVDEVEGDIVDAIASLVEKSLIRQGEGVGLEPRFGMLETIREFAAEQAAASGRRDALRAAHAAAFAEFAETAGPMAMSAEKRLWLDRLEEEHDNLRAAFAWAIEQGDAATAMRIGARLWRFWQMRGYLAEGIERLTAALGLAGSHDHPELRADALSAAAGMAYWRADAEQSRAWYREEIAARRALNDQRGLAEALYGLSFTWSVLELGQPEFADLAKEAIDQALAIFTELGDEGGIGRAEWALANRAYGIGDVGAAIEHATHAREVFERTGDSFMVGWSDFTLALGALAAEQVSGADQASGADQPSGADRPDRRADAQRWLAESLAIFSEAQDISGYTLVLDAMALDAYRSGDLERAARLTGAVRTLERTTGTGLNWWNRALLEFVPDDVFEEPRLAAIVVEGEAMTPEEAVAFALGD